MNISYCSNCLIGKAAQEEFLTLNNSAYDAAMDFRFFIENCFKTCPHKMEHLKNNAGD